jgi:hypothetical protein
MGKITLCEISLSKKVNLYFTKEQMIGVLNVETDKDLKVSGKFSTVRVVVEFDLLALLFFELVK